MPLVTMLTPAFLNLLLPAISINEPVTYDASSESYHAIEVATSSASPPRRLNRRTLKRYAAILRKVYIATTEIKSTMVGSPKSAIIKMRTPNTNPPIKLMVADTLISHFKLS